jgi:hypothetical protein
MLTDVLCMQSIRKERFLPVWSNSCLRNCLFYPEVRWLGGGFSQFNSNMTPKRSLPPNGLIHSLPLPPLRFRMYRGGVQSRYCLRANLVLLDCFQSFSQRKAREIWSTLLDFTLIACVINSSTYVCLDGKFDQLRL